MSTHSLVSPCSWNPTSCSNPQFCGIIAQTPIGRAGQINDVAAAVHYLASPRYTHHQSVPEIHQQLCTQSVVIAERTVTNLLARYEELVALYLTDQGRLRDLLIKQDHFILALDGLQPDVGHEVLWVLRDCLYRSNSVTDVRTGYIWVHRAAHLLANGDKRDATQVR